MHAPNSTALRLPILVTAIVWTFSVKVVDPVPVPHRPANTLERPSKPIPRLRTPQVGGLDATNNEEAWYEPTWKVHIVIPQLPRSHQVKHKQQIYEKRINIIIKITNEHVEGSTDP